MPAQFSIGRDCQLVVIRPDGTQLDMPYVTGFESRQLVVPVRIERLDGVPMAANLPKGWEGSFEVERGDSNVDDFIAAHEATYFSVGTENDGTLYQYVTEVNSSVSTYEYTKVQFHLANAGAWKGDASVKQKLEFWAAKRKRV